MEPGWIWWSGAIWQSGRSTNWNSKLNTNTWMWKPFHDEINTSVDDVLVKNAPQKNLFYSKFHDLSNTSSTNSWKVFYLSFLDFLLKRVKFKSMVWHIKAGLNFRALWSHFFEQSFHSIDQKKNEAIPLAHSDVTVEKSWNVFYFFFKRTLHFYDVIFFLSKNDWSQKVRSQRVQVKTGLKSFNQSTFRRH